MTTPFLRTGPFSRASSISVKSLRAYHEQGILVPSAVDPATGYRAYAAEQLFDAAVLRRLRDLDVPLRQVRQVLDARDPAVTEQVLSDDGSEDATALVPVAAPIEVPAATGCVLSDVPGGAKAVAVHLGRYDTIGDTYRLLGGWVATNATPRDGDVVERYLVGPPGPDDEYRTEIEWPVEAPSTTQIPPTHGERNPR